MEHDEFLQAVCALTTAYAILSRAVARALPPQLAAVAAVDPLTRITLEQFGDPLVRWFRRGSTVRGVRVADGTLVFDTVAVLFLPGVRAEHDTELPSGWRDGAREVAGIDGGTLTLR
jgi:hypothetical protein